MLTRQDIFEGLQRLDELAREHGVMIDIAIYGDAALSLVYDIREATRDVDAVVNRHLEFLRVATAKVAEERNWPPDWLNDGVKGFLSEKEALRALPGFPGSPTAGLRIYTPTPEYLFAMKCLAMRPEGINGSHDISDIEFLADHARVPDVEAALRLVESFYPANQIPAKARFGIEEIMQRVVTARARDDSK